MHCCAKGLALQYFLCCCVISKQPTIIETGVCALSSSPHIFAWHVQHTITLFHTYLSVCSEWLVFSAIVKEITASFDTSQLMKLSKEIKFPECIKHKATELYSCEIYLHGIFSTQ